MAIVDLDTVITILRIVEHAAEGTCDRMYTPEPGGYGDGTVAAKKIIEYIGSSIAFGKGGSGAIEGIRFIYLNAVRDIQLYYGSVACIDSIAIEINKAGVSGCNAHSISGLPGDPAQCCGDTVDVGIAVIVFFATGEEEHSEWACQCENSEYFHRDL